MILLIDNYDSFVFNLARYVEELGCATEVVRNDAITVAEIVAMKPQGVILSPGPCTPKEAGVCQDAIREMAGLIPLLGVCLGHQALAAAWGGDVIRAPEPVHGRTAEIFHTEARLFAGLPSPFVATRYHSLIVDEQTLPAGLKVVARSEDGLPMALEHELWPVFGVQFHPESILTDGGHRILANFLTVAGVDVAAVPAGDARFERPSERSGEDLPLAIPPLHW